jgi:hypothetical protein
MQALEFWKAVTVDVGGVLDGVLSRLDRNEVRFCVIGGQGVNAYVEPLVSLDLDLVVAADDIERVAAIFGDGFTVRRFPHSLNVSAPGSELRVQFQTDPRYASFLDRAEKRSVLGLELPVAAVEDVLSGKTWAALDPTRRGSKRQKDMADIARLIEAFPHLRERVPAEILDRLL